MKCSLCNQRAKSWRNTQLNLQHSATNRKKWKTNLKPVNKHSKLKLNLKFIIKGELLGCSTATIHKSYWAIMNVRKHTIIYHTHTRMHAHKHTPVQSTRLTIFFTISVQVFFGLPLGLAPSTSYSIHFFTQSLSSFRSTCPYHGNLFRCSTEIMSSNPSLSLNSLLGTLSCSFTPHIHLTILVFAF